MGRRSSSDLQMRKYYRRFLYSAWSLPLQLTEKKVTHMRWGIEAGFKGIETPMPSSGAFRQSENIWWLDHFRDVCFTPKAPNSELTKIQWPSFTNQQALCAGKHSKPNPSYAAHWWSSKAQKRAGSVVVLTITPNWWFISQLELVDPYDFDLDGDYQVLLHHLQTETFSERQTIIGLNSEGLSKI